MKKKQTNALIKDGSSFKMKYPIYQYSKNPHPEIYNHIKMFSANHVKGLTHSLFHENFNSGTEIENYSAFTKEFFEAFNVYVDGEDEDIINITQSQFIEIFVNALLSEIEHETFYSLCNHLDEMDILKIEDIIKFHLPVYNAIHSTDIKLNNSQIELIKSVINNFRDADGHLHIMKNEILLRLHLMNEESYSLSIYDNLLENIQLDESGNKLKSLKGWAQSSFDKLSDILWQDKEERFKDLVKPTDDVKKFYIGIFQYVIKYNNSSSTYFHDGLELNDLWNNWSDFRKARKRRK
jgi:hypothetical protein